MNPENEGKMMCARCGVPLVAGETKFAYLGHEFVHSVPRCPQCDIVYISEDLTLGRIAEVETELENK